MSEPWSVDLTTRLCGEAFNRVDLGVLETASLIRMGTNAVYLATASGREIIVRISPKDYDPQLWTQQIALIDWLHDRGFPTSRALIDEVIDVEGHPVTFWEYIRPDDGVKVQYGPLGSLLSRYHIETSVYSGQIPEWEPLGALGSRIGEVETDDGFTEEDRRILESWRAKLTEEVSGLDFELPAGPLHGDVHTGNVVVHNDHLFLLDFDRISRGPREWDLTQVLTAEAHFALPTKSVDEFMIGYGWDLRNFEGFKPLVQLRALFMTSWLITLPRTEDVKSEIQRRMSYWKNPNEAPLWGPV